MPVLAGIASFLNLSAETVTFKFQLGCAVDSLKDGMRALVTGSSLKERTRLMEMYTVFCEPSDAVALAGKNTDTLQKERRLLLSVLQDRRAMKDLTMLVKLRDEGHNIPLTTENVERCCGREPWFQRLKGMGSLVLNATIPPLIFIASARYFASRGLVTLAAREQQSFNMTTVAPMNGTYSQDAAMYNGMGCEAYETEVSNTIAVLLNLVGCCAAISAGILGSKLIGVVKGAMGKVDNLYLAFQNGELMDEVKELVFRRLGIRLPCLILSFVMAYCYHLLVKQTSEYAEELDVVESCDIDGFVSFLPHVPAFRPLIELGTQLIPIPYFYLMLEMIFSLVCDRTHQAEPEDELISVELQQEVQQGDDDSQRLLITTDSDDSIVELGDLADSTVPEDQISLYDNV